MTVGIVKTVSCRVLLLYLTKLDKSRMWGNPMKQDRVFQSI